MHDPFYDLFPAPSPPEWRRGELALLTIDMQYMDAHPDGWMGRVARTRGQEGLLAERYAAIERVLPRIVEALASELAVLLAPAPATAYAEPLVDSATVAAYLAIRPQWVRANSAKLRARRLSGSTMRFSLAEVDAVLLQASKNGSKPDA